MKATSIATFTVRTVWQTAQRIIHQFEVYLPNGETFRSTPQKIIWKIKLKTILITWDFQGRVITTSIWVAFFSVDFPARIQKIVPMQWICYLVGNQLLKRKVVALLPTYSRWWQLKYFWLSSLTWGNDAIWRSYLSNGLNHQLLIWFPFWYPI